MVPYDDDVNYVGWPALIELQFHRIGGATLPWALAQSHGLVAGLSHWIGGACVAAALAAICLPCVRHRAAWAALALCGWGWTLLACRRLALSRHPARHILHPREQPRAIAGMLSGLLFTLGYIVCFKGVFMTPLLPTRRKTGCSASRRKASAVSA